MKLLSAFTAAMVLVTATSHASSLASDNAADLAYNGGVINGQNGGTGFGAWVEQSQNGPSGSGSFLGSSQNNGFSDGNIDVSGKSWGLYANTNGDVNGNTEVLYRNFTGGSLGVGQTLTLSMDNGFIDSNKVVGLVLRTGTDTSSKNNGSRFEFLFIGDNNPGNYFAFGSSFDDTGVGYTSAGLDLAFTLTGTDAYSLSISNHSTGGVAVHTGTLGGTSGAGIDSIALYNQTAGDGGSRDLFFNSLAIIPEPQSVLLVVMGLAGLWAVIRRRTSATVVAVLGLALAIPGAFASIITVASDNSANAAYSDPFPQWDTGDNGGFGFGAWTLSPDPNTGNAGFFTATATQNGTYPSGGAINASDGDSWGMYAKSGDSAVAYRGFTSGDLKLANSFHIEMDNGYVDGGGGAVGLILRTGNDTTSKNNGQRFEFAFFGGGANYLVITNAGDPSIDTGVPYTEAGLQLDFSLLTTNTFSLRIIRIENSQTNTITGSLGGTPGALIQSVALYNQHAGDGQNYDLFFNNMQMTEAVPEPTMVAMLLVGGMTVYLRRRRHARS